MSDRRKTLLIGGAIILAIPFFAGILRRNAIHLPRPVMIALVMAAGLAAIVGIYILLRNAKDHRNG